MRATLVNQTRRKRRNASKQSGFRFGSSSLKRNDKPCKLFWKLFTTQMCSGMDVCVQNPTYDSIVCEVRTGRPCLSSLPSAISDFFFWAWWKTDHPETNATGFSSTNSVVETKFMRVSQNPHFHCCCWLATAMKMVATVRKGNGYGASLAWRSVQVTQKDHNSVNDKYESISKSRNEDMSKQEREGTFSTKYTEKRNNRTIKWKWLFLSPSLYDFKIYSDFCRCQAHRTPQSCRWAKLLCFVQNVLT